MKLLQAFAEQEHDNLFAVIIPGLELALVNGPSVGASGGYMNSAPNLSHNR